MYTPKIDDTVLYNVIITFKQCNPNFCHYQNVSIFHSTGSHQVLTNETFLNRNDEFENKSIDEHCKQLGWTIEKKNTYVAIKKSSSRRSATIANFKQNIPPQMIDVEHIWLSDAMVLSSFAVQIKRPKNEKRRKKWSPCQVVKLLSLYS